MPFSFPNNIDKPKLKIIILDNTNPHENGRNIFNPKRQQEEKNLGTNDK